MIDEENKRVTNKGYKLTDKISLDSLSGIGAHCKNYGLAGGMGVSIYCYPRANSDVLRRTNDVDITIFPNLSTAEFKSQIAVPVCQYLSELGYACNIAKPRSNFEIGVGEGTPLFLHFSRRSQKWLERFKRRIIREIENVNEVTIPERDRSILVLRPEDIILPKLQRKWEKDIADLYLILRYGPKLNSEYLKESAHWWFGGEEKLISGTLEELERLKRRYL